jgi:DNA-binding NtrC family response regulator
MSTRPPMVLVLDDEPDLVENLSRMLGLHGYRTRTATDALEALARIEAEPPDLVLTDLSMPGVDGMEFLARLRAASPDLPAIVITAYASIDSAVEAMKTGATDYMTKPFSMDELLLRVRKALAWNSLLAENRSLRERISSTAGAEAAAAEPQPMQRVRDAERELIVETLRECGGNRSLAAQRLGIGRRTLYDKIARLGITLGAEPRP